jgi:hypothetical protein
MVWCMVCGGAWAQVADIGHLYAPKEVHIKWSERLEEEMWLQGDVEKRRNMKVRPAPYVCVCVCVCVCLCVCVRCLCDAAAMRVAETEVQAEAGERCTRTGGQVCKLVWRAWQVAAGSLCG